MIYQVSTSLQALVRVRKPQLQDIPHKWHDLLKFLEHYMPKMKVDKVLWEFPKEGWNKVNSDGASRGNPGRSTIGFYVRDDRGDIIHAYGQEIQDTTNTKAEAVAILEALRYCYVHHLSNIWLGTDSMFLKTVIMENWITLWMMTAHVEEIRRLMVLCHTRISHIFREGNKLAEHLANYALDTGPIVCDVFSQLDSTERRLLNDDKLLCPH